MIAELQARGALSDLDVHLARTLARLAGERRDAVLLATALASRAVGQGHVCLDLSRLATPGGLVDDAGAVVETDTWPRLGEWLEVLAKSPLVGDATAITPLVLDAAAGRLYLRRYWRYESALAAAIAARAAAADPDIDLALLRAGLARLFPDAPGAPRPDWQRVAAFAAVQRRFCVISGGPGTGKTYTVVRILALLAEQALGRGAVPPRVALLAPTGKAAARLTEAIRAGKAGLACSDAVRAAIPDEAQTLHRGLGSVPRRSAVFRRDRAHPLQVDVALVDEASMVDLSLMAHLVDALPAAARLILLGDQDQLASVEAGAVLGDICNSGAPRALSHAFVAAALAARGAALPAPAGGLGDAIVVLTHSHRYDAEGGIGRLARAVNGGDLAAVDAALVSDAAVRRLDAPADGSLDGPLADAIVAGFAPYCAAVTPLERLQALGRFRVLCAHRRGPFGVATVNAQIEQMLAVRAGLQPEGDAYPGRPILVTRNDYGLGLFNGDVGVIAAHADDPGRRVAHFPAADGGTRPVAVARLPEHETVFAMSVHKSQGSEFDAVAVLLPREPSPVVSRELLYTALTRARHHALLVATPAVLAYAVATPVQRASGLRDRLWPAAQPAAQLRLFPADR
jgi:exodeoxyribonuclease V alpha subunit